MSLFSCQLPTSNNQPWSHSMMRILQTFLIFQLVSLFQVTHQFGQGVDVQENTDFRRLTRSVSDPDNIEDSEKDEENFSVTDVDPEDVKLIQSICTKESQNASSNFTTSKEDLSCILLKKMVRKSSTNFRKQQGRYIPEDYNKYEPPRQISIVFKNRTKQIVEDPVECGVYLNIRDISDFDEENELMTLDIDVILLWTDNNILNRFRRASPQEQRGISERPEVLNPAILKKLWTPDIYFEEITTLLQPSFMGNSVTVVLNPRSGLVVYRARILAKLSCNMDFAFYPADTQSCSFTLKSFSYTTKFLRLSWILQGGTGVYLHDTSDPNFNYQISGFSSEDTYLDIGPASDKTSKYTNLEFTILARRKMTYHLIQTYFASVFFVVVTWLCFLIPPDMFEVRVGIAMSTLLTLTAMFAAVRESAPNVSYVKAIDIWMVFCIMFIFVALGGFTVTAWIKRGLSRIAGPQESEVSLDTLRGKQRRVLDDSETKKLLRKYHIATVLTERFAVYILSFSFVLFNVFYWSWLMMESGYMNWRVNATFNNIGG